MAEDKNITAPESTAPVIPPLATTTSDTESSPSSTQTLSQLVYRELTSQKISIQFKQFDEKHIERFIEEINNTEKDLLNRGITDTVILFNIATEERDYSGASKEQFINVFRSSPTISSLSIELNADIKDKKYSKTATFKAMTTSTPIKNQSTQIFVLGDEPIWVSNTSARMQVTLETVKTVNKVLYSNWTELFVQLLAVLVILAVSLKVTSKWGHIQGLNNSEIYVFATALLFGSNVWTYLSRFAFAIRSDKFPVVGFKQRSFEGLIKTAVLSVVTLVVAWTVETLLTSVIGTSYIKGMVNFLKSIF